MDKTSKNKGDEKIIYYFSPPKQSDKLNELDLKILEIVKGLGQASVNDILAKIRPEYKTYPQTKDPNKVSLTERIKLMKHVWKTAMVCGDIALAVKKLKKYDCVRIIPSKEE